MTAAAIPGVMSPDYTVAEQVSFNDPEIVGDQVIYPPPDGHGEMRADPVRRDALAGMPRKSWAEHPCIEDVARRLAKAGFLAPAPDGLTSVGGYPGDDEAGKELQATRARYEAFIYPGGNHGFDNDSTPRCDPAAAGPRTPDLQGEAVNQSGVAGGIVLTRTYLAVAREVAAFGVRLVSDRASRIVVIGRDMSHDQLADSLQVLRVRPGL